eukprot:351759-Chlamydomonas_euryale.AAC.2
MTCMMQVAAAYPDGRAVSTTNAMVSTRTPTAHATHASVAHVGNTRPPCRARRPTTVPPRALAIYGQPNQASESPVIQDDVLIREQVSCCNKDAPCSRLVVTGCIAEGSPLDGCGVDKIRDI